MTMDIKDMITRDTIDFNLDLKTREEILERITEILLKSGRILEKEDVLKGYIDRENECTTGIGFGLSIPHCKSESIIKPTIIYLTLKNPVEWESLDEEPVSIVIGLAIPKKDEGTLHLEILGCLASNLMEEDFKDSLFKIDDKDKLIDFLYENLNIREE